MEETHFTGMPSVDVSQGKYITPPKRLVMLLHCDKNRDFSVHWVTLRTLGQISDCLAFSEICLFGTSPFTFLFFVFSVALVYVLSVLIICAVSYERDEVKGMQIPRHKKSVLQSGISC